MLLHPTAAALGLLVTVLAAPAHAEDVQALLAGLKHPDAAVHDDACAKLLRLGPAARTVLVANLGDVEASRFHRLSYLIDRIDALYLPGDPWDRSRDIIVGRELEVWLEGDTKHVKVREGTRRVHLWETRDRITVEATGPECGRDVTEQHAARGPQELSHLHWGAFDVYNRWGGGIGRAWEVEGRALTGSSLRAAGPIVRQTASKGFDVFRAWIRGQMAAAQTPAAGRAQVEKGITDMLAALSLPNSDPAKNPSFTRAADAVRGVLKELALPDPGELLPAPANVRLGVTTVAGPTGRPRINNVPPDSRAARLGLAVGDVIVAIQGRDVDRGSLAEAVRKVGEAPMVVSILRDGQPLELREAGERAP